MNDLKQKAQEFCEATNIQDVRSGLDVYLAKFAQSLIDQGIVVEAVKYNFCRDELAEVQQAVSSDGKEVRALQECKGEYAVEIGFVNWEAMRRQSNKLSLENRIDDFYNQFKSSPASTEQPKDTPQLGEVKTLQECKNEIAMLKYESTFGQARHFVHEDELMVCCDEAAELYASQFKSNLSTPLKEITDQEIVDKAIELEMEWSTSGEMLKTTLQLQFCKMARWYYDKSKENKIINGK